jgi:glycosyltransferase involved in cell wall biosynthesis
VALRPSGAPQLLIPLNRHALQSAANVRMFLHDYWSVIAEAEPIADVSLAITGVDPAQLAAVTGLSVGEQQRLRVKALGFLQSLTPAFENSIALIAPTFIGSGIRKKILEGMAHQIPVIATDFDISTCSYFSHGDNILRLGTPSEFVATVGDLLRDNDLWGRLSANGRTTVERHANWALFAEALIEEMSRTIALRAKDAGNAVASQSIEPATL